tara:strand:+ start:317 stop:736 length:420 start_codon:yes stop_codon:yes gene_type:complete
LISPKNFIIILIATIAVSLVILVNPSPENDSDFSHFTFDAVYMEDKNSILITFADTTGKSSFAILEILGMETTYHTEFEIVNSEFSKTVPIEKIPKYGWKTTPVILEIMYGDTIVKMKTEIHEEDNQSPEIIFSSSSSN